jgi:hypothetical protein
MVSPKQQRAPSTARPILITGSHRSGTTWVGTVIGKSEDVCYIPEPFNKLTGPGICNIGFDYWFPYVTEENEKDYLIPIEQTLQFKYHLFQELKSVRKKRQLPDLLQNSIRFQRAKRKKQRPLFKDPIAVFSADWLSRRFDFQIIVMIRHPAAFVSSIKRLNWKFPFVDFLRQPLLLNGPLKEYRSEITNYARSPRDIIDQASLLWKVIYSRVYDYRKNHPDWIFVRHEDISLQPKESFEFLYRRLGLRWTEQTERTMWSYSSSRYPAESPQGKTRLKLDSPKSILNWKKRLTPQEIERIKMEVSSVAARYYSESEW